jgi:hypothetical protein
LKYAGAFDVDMLGICFHSRFFFVEPTFLRPTLLHRSPGFTFIMNVMNARRVLGETGFITLYRAVEDDFIANLRSTDRHVDLFWNDGSWNGEAFDPLRIRARLPAPIYRALEAKFDRHYMTFFAHSLATEWTLLRTFAGAAESSVRRDFSPPLPDVHTAELSALPAVLLFATQDDTILYGYGWNRLVATRN